MGLFGFGDDPTIGRAGMSSEYSGGFARGQQEGFGDVGSARAVGEEQRRLAEALRAQAEGRTPSLAAMQYASALEQSQAAAASQLASARGLSPAQAQRLLMTQQSAARAGAAGQSAMMRLQEQQAAQGALANVLAQQRQQALLGASTASGIGAQAGQLGLAQQQMEQQRIIAEQQLRMQQQQQMEKGIATGVGAVAGSLFGPAGTAIGAKIGSAFASKGGEIKGRAQYNGDTRSNDTVPALLSPGEIVLPRSVAQDEDAPEKSKKFVEAIKKQKKPAGKASIAAALARIQELEARLNAMEALADLEAEEQG
jgi:hypothetical protein